MSEKELLYIDDALGHFTNLHEYLENYIIGVEGEKFKTVLEELETLNKDLYKKFYKLLDE